MRLILAGKNNIGVDVLDYCRRNLDIPIFAVINKTETFKNSWQKSFGFYARLWNIPIVELNPVEGLYNNIFGAYNISKSIVLDEIISSNHSLDFLLFIIFNKN